MLYYAPFTTTAVEDARFTSRGAGQHVQGPVSRLITDVVPEVKQLAYSVYKDNIDLFLAATATQSPHSITGGSVDTPFVQHTFPLLYPKTVVSFPATLKKDTTTLLLKLMRANCLEMTQIEGLPKFPCAYALTRPNLSVLRQIEPAAGPSPAIGGTCGLKSTLAIATVFSAVELYMRLNTYPAYSSDEDSMSVPGVGFKRTGNFVSLYNQISKHPKTRYKTVNMTHDEEPNKGKKEDGIWVGASEAKEDFPLDLEPSQLVTARPGSKVNSSWGLPSVCPTKCGICFEYFIGMNTPDKSFMQRMICLLYFRCFGKDPQSKYLAFREDIQGAAGTEAGLALTHMLKGIEISLDAQAQFFAMFDGPAYLGFVILGAKWRIRWGAHWELPLPSADLQKELLGIKTHTSSLEDIVLELNAAGLMLNREDVDTGVKLARALATLTWEGTPEEVKEKQKRVETIVGRLDFRTKQVGFAIETFTKAIGDLDPTEDISGQHVTFPSPQYYPLFLERYAIVLSRFGYKTPSFEIYKGKDAVFVNKEEYRLGKETEKGKEALSRVKTLMVAEKPFHTAVKDFAAFLKEPKIFQSSGERSGVYKNHTFKMDRKDTLLLLLSMYTKNIVVAEKSVKAKGKEKGVFVEDDFVAKLKASLRATSRAPSVGPSA